ncbi:hypothetical protein T265_00374 [Opisthorchis viverrini]|uniref:Pyridoxal-dependent decarboxylase domain protein n=1 Tax=Opisthorchis viverrini TaxID=6198 RepID=A0A075AD02_OPIVI|nr:hypothetical protein T265_00374 [Opisthorchis viverrini]KER33940.1 hypothetical protein T265_00374 [Opisthorchis viverrini]
MKPDPVSNWSIKGRDVAHHATRMGNLMAGFSGTESPHLQDLSVEVKATQNGRCEDKKRELHSLLAPSEFREQGCRMVNYIADYLESAHKLRVFPTVNPGYLARLIPKEAPEEPEPWSKIMEDVDRVIMPGITHWQHPRFHAYFPSGTSCPSMCADILTNGFGCIGFTWASSPVYTELEIVMMDWLARLLHLPEYFLSGGDGGGVIQVRIVSHFKHTFSKCTFVAREQHDPSYNLIR